MIIRVRGPDGRTVRVTCDPTTPLGSVARDAGKQLALSGRAYEFAPQLSGASFSTADVGRAVSALGLGHGSMLVCSWTMGEGRRESGY